MNTLNSFFIHYRFNILFYLGCCFLMQSCAGSQVGKKLADSFENPLEPIKSSKEVKVDQIQKTVIKEKVSQLVKKEIQPTLAFNERKFSPKIDDKSKQLLKADKNFTPKPYRIIIRVPSVNPSAPAETVTSALRNAGVIFEVEKIERFDKKSIFKSSSSR